MSEKNKTNILSLSIDKLKNRQAQQTQAESIDASDTVNAAQKLSSVLNTAGGGFGGNEEMYSYYRDKYTEDALKASENAFGLAASATGGYSNTYASSVAESAYRQYMEGLYDRLYDEKKQNYEAAVSFAEKAAKLGDYSYYETLGADTSAVKEQNEFDKAVEKAKYGDYSGLENAGVDTTLLRYSELLDIAQKLSENGDYSALEALGINTESLKENDLLEKATALAKYGDFSLLGNFSDTIKSVKSKIGFTVQKGAQTAYETGGYRGLLSYLQKQEAYGQIDGDEKQRIISAITGM